MVLIHEATGKVAKIGDEVVDFRGDCAVIIGMTPPRHEGSTGRVEVRSGCPGEEWTQEFYPKVFGLKWVEGLRAVDGLRRRRR